MEIIDAKCATLCNHEVLKHLQKLKDKGRRPGQVATATITYETIQYLENTPCEKQTAQSIRECLKDLTPYNLNKQELLMIINTPPCTPLEIQLIVEDSEARLTEEQVQEILGIISKHFPHVVKQDTEEKSE